MYYHLAFGPVMFNASDVAPQSTRTTNRISRLGRGTALALSFLTLFCLSACNGKWWHNIPGYNGFWWNRGQPKSVAELLSNSQDKLTAALKNSESSRAELVPLARGLEQQLLDTRNKLLSSGTQQDMQTELTKTEHAMMTLEGKLSVGSRAAYGELAGELRTFSEKVQAGQQLDDPDFRSAFSLYTARTLSFLANELSVPAPVV
jgi:hypothetical protein